MSNPTRTAELRRSNCRSLAARVTAVTALALLCLAAPPPAARAQTTAGSPDLVISQVYTRGGEAGASYRHDFVEIFNRGTEPVDMNNYGLHVTLGSTPFPSTLFVRFASSQGIVVQPGRYLLVAFKGDGADGQPLPTPDFDLSILPAPVPANLSAPSGTVGLLMPDSSFRGCPTLSTTGVVDFVGYGEGSTCFEGPPGPAPAPTLAESTQRLGGGCADNNVNALDFRLSPVLPRNSAWSAGPCAGVTPSSTFNFFLPQYDVSEGDGRAEIIVSRVGDTSEAASVEYTITGGTAFGRSDYTTAAGRLRFAPGETRKTFDILLTDDATPEWEAETIDLLLWKPEGGGAVVGSRGTARVVIRDNDPTFTTGNPADTTAFFVRQHYHDFLNREPDPEGLQFWTDNIESCGADAVCREVKRIDTSAAFFLSIEFQRTGFFVHRVYRAALPERDYRPRSLPRYAEFVRDTQEVGRGVVVNRAGWEQRLDANTALFLADFMSRAEFALTYPQTLTAAGYVDRLNAQAGAVLSADERERLVQGMTDGTETRASVLRQVAEHPEFARRETGRAFVLMQYFGYLRRAPNDPPDADFSGLDFWLGKLDSFGGDYRRAEMVKAFIASVEYRARFYTPAP